jgi:hypothetical protein
MLRKAQPNSGDEWRRRESNPRKIAAANRPDVSGSPALPCHGELSSSLPPRPVRFVA